MNENIKIRNIRSRGCYFTKEGVAIFLVWLFGVVAVLGEGLENYRSKKICVVDSHRKVCKFLAHIDQYIGDTKKEKQNQTGVTDSGVIR